jgi:hypothetical protein
VCAVKAAAAGGGPQNGSSGGSEDKEGSYAYSDPVNRALGTLLPRREQAAAALSHIDWAAPKAAGLPLEELAQRFTREFVRCEWCGRGAGGGPAANIPSIARAHTHTHTHTQTHNKNPQQIPQQYKRFVTGDVPCELFSDDFKFKDDSVATAGIRSYAEGVRKLFDQQTARAELITVVTTAAAAASSDSKQQQQRRREGGGSIVATWRLEGRVNLPFKPAIPPYVVTTTLAVGADDGLICSQLDEFSVPGWQLLAGALLGPWAAPPPAPPASELRAQARAEGKAGVVDPEKVLA